MITDQKCGYVALLGRPNAGKSTLLNSLVGQKLAGVSAKAQTTRNRIVGIVNVGPTQVLVLDTPGLHQKMPHRINQLMNQLSWASVGQADIVGYLIDGVSGWHDDDSRYLAKILATTKAPVLPLLTKADRTPKAKRREFLELVSRELSRLDLPADAFSIMKKRLLEPLPFSSKNPVQVSELASFFASFMPEGPWLYTEDQLTDRSQRFIASEMIREQLFRQLGEEIPYGATVVVTKVDQGEKLVKVFADIYVARESQKPMVIGKKGARIKEIGLQSRTTLEQHFGCSVYLDLHVRVKVNWMDQDRLVKELSYLGEDFE